MVIKRNHDGGPTKLTFFFGQKPCITITEEHGIKFHLDVCRDYTPDDFAKAFIYNLEQNFDIIFKKKVSAKKSEKVDNE